MKEKLTPAQEKVFNFICSFKNEYGYPPTYKDIAREFNFKSDGTVKTYLIYLEQKGYIKREGKARGLKILVQEQKEEIPILGQIAAGQPILATEDRSNTINEVNVLQFTPHRFALKVKGDSMIDAGIFDGDYAIIDKQAATKNGDIAAVMIEEEATLKRLDIKPDKILLQAENPNYSPIEINKTTLQTQIVGKYIGLIRSN